MAQINPDFAIVYYNLGVAYLDAGHRGKAYTNFKIFLDKEKTGRTAKIVREHIKNIKY